MYSARSFPPWPEEAITDARIHADTPYARIRDAEVVFPGTYQRADSPPTRLRGCAADLVHHADLMIFVLVLNFLRSRLAR